MTIPPPGWSGSGASRVQKTKPFVAGSLEVMPSWKGETRKAGSARIEHFGVGDQDGYHLLPP
jgi:hypothetical protein